MESMGISEAAQRLGVHERRIRHIISRNGWGSRLESVTRHTKTGIRQASALPPALFDDVAKEVEKELAASAGVKAAKPAAQKVAEPGAEVAAADQRLVVIYERLLAEKDQRIADLQDALEHERESHRRSQESLGRSQVLSLPPAPAAKTSWWRRWFGLKS